MFSITEGKKYLVLILIITYLLSLSACGVINPDLYGSIDIKSSPPEAKVYLDGVNTGQITPTVLPDVPAGTHTVKLELCHYKSKEDTNVVVTAGETTILEWTLTYASIQILHLQPGSEEGKDTYVSLLDPDYNLDNLSSLCIGYHSLNHPTRYRSYMYFDVSSSLPLDAVVTSTYLKINHRIFMGTGSLQIGIYPVTGDWEESTITWNNQPTSSSEAESTDYLSSSTENTWIFFNIGDLVKGWVDGSIPNKGMLLKPVHEPATNGTCFSSSDISETFSYYRPQLLITYYIP